MKKYIRIFTPDNFSFHATVNSHGWRQLAPFQYDEQRKILHRVHQLRTGKVVKVSFSDEANDCITVKAELASLTPPEQAEIRSITRTIFNLDLDLTEFYDLVRNEEEFAWVDPAGAGRLLRSPTVWEDLAKTLLTTNTTWGNTRKMVSQLTSLGKPFSSEDAAFPAPEQVAELSPEDLGERVKAGYRTEYLHDLSIKISWGDIDVEHWDSPELSSEELFAKIKNLKGFGPYAAGATLKLLGHFDMLALDSVARSYYAEMHNHGEPVSDSDIRDHYQSYGRWKGLVLWMDILKHAQ